MNIRQIALSFIACIGISLYATAQSEETPTKSLSGHMTLSECVRYAQEHSPRLLPLSSRLQALALNESIAKQAFIPSVNASVGENISVGRSQGQDGTFRNINSANTDFKIGASWEVLTAGRRWWSLKRSQEELKSRDYIIAETKDQIALNVTEDYISVLLAKQMVDVAKENLSLSTALFEQTKIEVQVGKLPLSQKIQIESQVGQDQLTLTEAQADLERAVRILLLDMGVDMPSASLDIPELQPEEIAARLESVNTTSHNGQWMTPTTRLAQTQYELSEYDLKQAKAGYWPSLNLNTGYSNGYYYAFGDGITPGMNASFGEQIKKNGRTFIGVELNIPIYNKGQVTSQIRQAQIQQMNLQSQLVQHQFDDARNIAMASTELKKAEEQYRISTNNISLTKQALDIAEKEYTAGRITTYEWDQAKNKYLIAKGNYLRSIYNRLLRTINLTYFNTGVLPLHLAE